MFQWLRRKTADLFGAPRSGKWKTVRSRHLNSNPYCAACGKKEDLEVHHIRPVHVAPHLELEPTNLITLCADPCHLVHGHLMSWARFNPECAEDCRKYREKLRIASAAVNPYSQGMPE